VLKDGCPFVHLVRSMHKAETEERLTSAGTEMTVRSPRGRTPVLVHERGRDPALLIERLKGILNAESLVRS